MALFGTPHKRRPGETMRHQMPAQQALPWAQGGKAGWKDFAGLALAGIGDAFSNANGGQSGAMQNMIAGRETTRMEALRAAAEAAAEARKRQAGREDKQWEWDNKPQDAQQPPANVQEALWWQNATPEQRTAFREANPTVYQTANGPQIYGLENEYKDIGAPVPISQLMGQGSPQQPMNAPSSFSDAFSDMQQPQSGISNESQLLQMLLAKYGSPEGTRRFNRYKQGGF